MDEIFKRMLTVLENLADDKGVKPNNSDKNINKKNKRNFNSDDKSLAIEFAKIFTQVFLEQEKKNKQDTAQQTAVKDIAKKNVQTYEAKGFDPNSKKSSEGGGGFGWLAAISGLVGIVSLLYGLATDGPFKGLSKLVAKFSLGAFKKMLAGSISRIVGGMKNLLKVPFEMVGRFGSWIMRGFKSISGRVFGKVVGKEGGKAFGGIVSNLLKFIKPLGKVLKRIPVLGLIISGAYAYSRFKNGDIRGGIIDTLSGLVSLLDLVAPGVGTVLSLGLDILNGYLDYKGGGEGEKKQEKSSTNPIMDMVKSAGDWMWKNAKHIPLLGTFKFMGEAWESIKAGNWMDGLGLMGKAIISIIPGGGLIIDGIEAMMGWFGGSSEEGKDIKPNSSWMDGIKNWIKKKMELLPWPIKKALSWMGIMDDPDGTSGGSVEGDAGKSLTSSVTDTVTGMYSGIKDNLNNAWEGSKKAASEMDSWIQDKAKGLWEKTKNFGSWVSDKAEGMWDSSVKIAKDVESWRNDTLNKWFGNKSEENKGNTQTRMEEIAVKIEQPLEKPKENIQQYSIQDYTPSPIKDPLLKGVGMITHKVILYLPLIYKELVNIRMNSGHKTGQVVGNTVISPLITAPKTSSDTKTISDNRSGYVSSHYSLA